MEAHRLTLFRIQWHLARENIPVKPAVAEAREINGRERLSSSTSTGRRRIVFFSYLCDTIAPPYSDELEGLLSSQAEQ